MIFKTTSDLEFILWLQRQEHQWNERLNRRKAINNMVGCNMDTRPFPLELRNGKLYLNGSQLEAEMVDTDILEVSAWGEANE